MKKSGEDGGKRTPEDNRVAVKEWQREGDEVVKIQGVWGEVKSETGRKAIIVQKKMVKRKERE